MGCRKQVEEQSAQGSGAPASAGFSLSLQTRKAPPLLVPELSFALERGIKNPSLGLNLHATRAGTGHGADHRLRQAQRATALRSRRPWEAPR